MESASFNWILIFTLLAVVRHSMAMLIEHSDIEGLRGEADFRSVTLEWRMSEWSLRDWPLGRATFRITACEIQFWGASKCRTQMMADNGVAISPGEGVEVDERIRWRRFRTTMNDLRLATNYTFNVATTTATRAPTHPKVIAVQTKGFAGHSSQCLGNSSRVEVETGPHFSGRISVEDSTDPRCYVDGERTSEQTRYALVIDHSICGSWVNQSSVVTYVIVQENPSILTHTARRFVVVCHHQPDVFVVESGIKMPVVTRNQAQDDVDDDHDSRFNFIHKNDLTDKVDQQLRNHHEADVDEEEHSFSVGDSNSNKVSYTSQAQLVIMIGLLLCSFIGLSAGTLIFILRQQSRTVAAGRRSAAVPAVVSLSNCPPARRQFHILHEEGSALPIDLLRTDCAARNGTNY